VLENDEDYMVFKRKSDDGIILACRGTSGLDDVIPDMFIGFGALRYHPRAWEITEAVRNYKNTSNSFVVTGHSLGGKMAALMGESEGVLAVTFNQGSSPMDSNPLVVGLQTSLGGYNYNNVIHFTTGFDGVSTTEAVMQNYHTFHVTPPSSVNPLENHSLSVFRDIDDSKYSEFIQTELDRLNPDTSESRDKPVLTEKEDSGSVDVSNIMGTRPTTVDHYNAQKRLIEDEWDTGKYDGYLFIEQGNKMQGDKERDSEFQDRYTRWRTTAARESIIRNGRTGRQVDKRQSNAVSVTPVVDDSGPDTVSSVDGGVFTGTDGVTVCATKKRKSSVLDTVSVSKKKKWFEM
jgi:hypothetical protein